METTYDDNQLLILCRAMANVAASDGRITDEEREQLEETVVGLGLSPSDPRVREVIDAEFAKPGNLTEIVRGLTSRELRAALLRMLIEVSCADGQLALAEREKVREAGREFGFADAVVVGLVDWTLDSIAMEAREQELMAKLLG